MMKQFIRRLFFCSFAFFILSYSTTKYLDNPDIYFGWLKLLCSMPIESWEGRDTVLIDINGGTKQQIADILKKGLSRSTTKQTEQPLHVFSERPEYVILQFKNAYYNGHWGDIKCYCSAFPYAIENFIFFETRTNYNRYIIFYYPVSLDKDSRPPYIVSTRWKNFWGFP